MLRIIFHLVVLLCASNLGYMTCRCSSQKFRRAMFVLLSARNDADLDANILTKSVLHDTHKLKLLMIFLPH